MSQDTLQAIADEMGLTASGVRKRIHALGLQPERGSRGRVMLTPELETTLREADRLFRGGAGAATVRRVLGLSGDAQEPPTSSPSKPILGPVTLAPLSGEAQEIREAVTQAIANQTELAERYARAAHRVGELEATTRALEADRDRVARELAEQADKRAHLEAELAQAQAAAAEQARAIATLADELTRARRPWWKLW